MNYKKREKRKKLIIRIVALICAILLIGSVASAVIYTL